MATALKELGFTVIERFDATQKEMNRAIVEFGGKLRTGTVALFYFAGHGLQVRGKNYLVPIDAEITAEASIRAEAVDVDTVIDQLAASDLSVVILDACRNNPYERRFRGIGGGLAQMEAPKGSLIAYATAPGMTAFDGSGRNGLYTSELLKEIRKRGQPIEGVFKNVRRNVAKATRDQQVPWESSSLIGDFYFNPVVISVETKPEIPVAQPAVVSPPSVAATAIKTEPEAKAERKTETVKTDVAKASGAARPEPSPAAAPALGVVSAQTARVETKPETPVAQPAAGAPPSVATTPIKADAQVKVAPEPKAGTKA
jgi:hypothetical protein